MQVSFQIQNILVLSLTLDQLEPKHVRSDGELSPQPPVRLCPLVDPCTRRQNRLDERNVLEVLALLFKCLQLARKLEVTAMGNMERKGERRG